MLRPSENPVTPLPVIRTPAELILAPRVHISGETPGHDLYRGWDLNGTRQPRVRACVRVGFARPRLARQETGADHPPDDPGGDRIPAPPSTAWITVKRSPILGVH